MTKAGGPSADDSVARTLRSLGTEPLARALLDLAAKNSDAARTVARLTAKPADDARRAKAAIAALRRRRRFVPYREARDFADDLRAILADIESSAADARRGVELVATLYACDSAVLEACDDSDGFVGDVFRLDARDLFVRYASQCDDKEWLAALVFDLLREDEYGVRDAILARAAHYLPQTVLRDLAERMWTAAGPATTARQRTGIDFERSHWFLLVEAVARQLNDPRLFERARRAHTPELGTAACVHIARAWLAGGDARAALDWLERIPREDTFLADERDDLLRAAHQQLGNAAEVERIAWKQFRASRGRDTLDDLLGVIGPGRREAVLTEATREILEEASFSPTDAAFLIQYGRTDDAAGLVIRHRHQIEGASWSALVPLAESFENSHCALAATVLYRALLGSILDRAQSAAYGHGADYLRRLGRLAKEVADWQGSEAHGDYVAGLRERHGRKSSFWARCGRVPL